MIETPQQGRVQRFHHYGPWTLVIAAVLVAIGIELERHHALHSEEFLFLVALLPTVILHEVSHGVVAYWFGDDTAKRAGRLSLNPIRHIDPIGTVLLPILLIVTTHSAFGWAKPVPVRVDKLRHPRNEAVLVGLAGPVTNVILALIAGFAFRLFGYNTVIHLANSGNIASWPLGDEFLFLFGIVNVIIAVFNLIPIPPLDGSAVIERLLPERVLPQYYQLRMLSMFLVIFLVLFDPAALQGLFNWGTSAWGRVIGIGPVKLY
ncbi:MAG: site-2 protease family protein [Acidimicrobiales bacterium]